MEKIKLTRQANKLKRRLFLLALLVIAGQGVAQVKIIAHRGASYLAPENTAVAAKLGWELGADAVEVDVHLTFDHRIMAIHDKTTAKTCLGKNLAIAKTPSMLLRDLDAGSHKGNEFKGEKIPFLKDLVKLIPDGRELVVEIKCGKEIVPYLVSEVEKTGKKSQLVFICFGLKEIIEIKNEFPNNECYWLSSSKSGVKKNIKKVANAGLEGINLDYKIIDSEMMELAKQHNLKVLSWTVDDSKEAKRLIGLGVEAITTNRPKWLKDQLN